MLVACPQCKARIKVPDERLKSGPLSFQCPKCSKKMLVRQRPPVPADMQSKPAPAPEAPPAATAPVEDKGAEKRKQQRVPFTDEILIDNAILVKGIDISEGGIYVHTGRSFVVGKVVDAAIPSRGGRLKIKVRIQHNQPGVGMGLMFVDLSDEARSVISSILERKRKDMKGAQPVAKDTVMLVDDNDTSRRMNKSRLVLDGFHVIDAAGGAEALKLLDSSLPGLIVLDLQMAGMDGLKVLSFIKQDPRWKDIPVVVLSSASKQDTIDEVMTAGAAKFLNKMVTNPLKLSGEVKSLMKAHARR